MRLSVSMILAACWLSPTAFAQAPDACELLSGASSNESLIVWYSGRSDPARGSPGRLRPIAVLAEGQLREPRNLALAEGDRLWSVTRAESEVVLSEIHAENFLYREGISYCMFSAEADLSDIDRHALFTSDKDFELRPPSVAERAEFEEQIYPVTHCANHGGMFLRDVPPEEIPPCEEPVLIGLSDINRNDRPEFWTTDILKFATGIAVWEYVPNGYLRIFSACPGCSD